MKKHSSHLLLAIVFILTNTAFAKEGSKRNSLSKEQSQWAKQCKDWDDWDKPGPAFKVFGNSYYVGSCGISAILITGDEGHILIDGGTEAGADIIMNNIKQLGFSVNDIKIILHSHEHFDHVAGIAKIQHMSGARLFASKAATPVLNTGITADIDPQAGMHAPFPAAKVNKTLLTMQPIKLGQLSLKPISTPGHSPGALSWQWQSCDKSHCLNIVYADSLSPVSSDTYSFSQHPSYLADYKKGLNQLEKLACDITIAPHPSASKLRERISSGQGLIDPNSCSEYAIKTQKRLDKRLAKEVARLD